MQTTHGCTSHTFHATKTRRTAASDDNRVGTNTRALMRMSHVCEYATATATEPSTRKSAEVCEMRATIDDERGDRPAISLNIRARAMRTRD